MNSNTWNVSDVKIRSKDYSWQHHTLVMKASPGSDNRKKWEGEFEFTLNDDLWEKLKEMLSEHADTERLMEIFKAEMANYDDEQLQARRQKADEIRNKLGLSSDDVKSF